MSVRVLRAQALRRVSGPNEELVVFADVRWLRRWPNPHRAGVPTVDALKADLCVRARWLPDLLGDQVDEVLLESIPVWPVVQRLVICLQPDQLS